MDKLLGIMILRVIGSQFRGDKYTQLFNALADSIEAGIDVEEDMKAVIEKLRNNEDLDADELLSRIRSRSAEYQKD